MISQICRTASEIYVLLKCQKSVLFPILIQRTVQYLCPKRDNKHRNTFNAKN